MLDAEVAQALAAADLGADELRERPADELRALKADCVRVEAKVSYLRRLVHGAIDLLPGAGRDSSELVEEVPELLAEHGPPPPHTHMVTNLAPPDIGAVTDELAALVGHRSLGSLPDLSEDEVRALRAQLEEANRALSDHRRTLFARIDALADELARRYRDGETTVDSVLPLP